MYYFLIKDLQSIPFEKNGSIISVSCSGSYSLNNWTNLKKKIIIIINN